VRERVRLCVRVGERVPVRLADCERDTDWDTEPLGESEREGLEAGEGDARSPSATASTPGSPRARPRGSQSSCGSLMLCARGPASRTEDRVRVWLEDRERLGVSEAV